MPSPRSRRPDLDEDEQADTKPTRKKKKKPKAKGGSGKLVFILLGAAAGLFLLCAGGGTGLYFGIIKPAADKARARNDALQAELDAQQRGTKPPPAPPELITKANLLNINSGMTKDEVEAILGKETGTPTEDALPKLIGEGPNSKTTQDRWQTKVRFGHVLKWEKGNEGIFVAFAGKPEANSKVVGVFGSFSGNFSEPVVLPEGIEVDAIELTKEFEANAGEATKKYKDTILRVRGECAGVWSGGDQLRLKGLLLWKPVAKSFTVHGNIIGESRGIASKCKLLQKVVMIGRFANYKDSGGAHLITLEGARVEMPGM